MKTTTGKVFAAWKALDSALTTSLETAERQKVVKIWYALAETAKRYSELIDKALKELKPENWDELAAKAQFTPEELAEFRKKQAAYNKEVEEVLQPESDKEVEVEVADKLSLDTALKLLAENKWPISKLGELSIVVNK